jgi:hypothetical protein
MLTATLGHIAPITGARGSVVAVARLLDALSVVASSLHARIGRFVAEPFVDTAHIRITRIRPGTRVVVVAVLGHDFAATANRASARQAFGEKRLAGPIVLASGGRIAGVLAASEAVVAIAVGGYAGPA